MKYPSKISFSPYQRKKLEDKKKEREKTAEYLGFAGKSATLSGV